MTMPAPRPGFAALLRAGLPASPLDIAPFIVVALVLRFFAKVSWPAAAAVAGVLIPVTIVLFAAGGYLVARFAPHAGAEDDDPGDSDGS